MQHILKVNIYLRELFQIRFRKDRAYEIVGNRGYDGYQMALASMGYTFFDIKSKSRISVNEQLAQELHKSVTNKFKRKKV